MPRQLLAHHSQPARPGCSLPGSTARPASSGCLTAAGSSPRVATPGSRSSPATAPDGAGDADRLLVGAAGLPRPGVLVDHARQAGPQGEAAMGNSQRLDDTEQLEILTLLEAASTEDSAMRA